jgi:MFS family permease
MGVSESLSQFLSGTRKDATSKPPLLLAWRSSKFFIITTVCLAVFTDIFFYALVVPVVPFALTVQVGLPEDEVPYWTAILLACYSSALFVSSPIMGLYADHTSSRRWPLLIGLVSLGAATILLCFSRVIGLMVLGRLLQGFSAGIVWSVGCALLVDTMDNAIGVAMGYVNVAMSVGLLVAPVVGGSVYAAAGYYPVYYIAFGVVIVDILMRLGMIEKKVAKQWIPEETTTAEPITTQDVEKTAEVVGKTAADAPVEGPAVAPAAQLPAVASTEAVPLQRRHKWPILILIRSPRLLAAEYCIMVQAGIM